MEEQPMKHKNINAWRIQINDTVIAEEFDSIRDMPRAIRQSQLHALTVYRPTYVRIIAPNGVRLSLAAAQMLMQP